MFSRPSTSFMTTAYVRPFVELSVSSFPVTDYKAMQVDSTPIIAHHTTKLTSTCI